MKKILVIVPFPMSEDNLKSRRDQLKSVKLSNELQFEFRSTKAAPKNYISQADMVLADVGRMQWRRKPRPRTRSPRSPA